MPKAKLCLTPRMLEQALNLKSGVYVTGAYVFPDPQRLLIFIEGEHLPVPTLIGEDDERYIMRLNEVQE